MNTDNQQHTDWPRSEALAEFRLNTGHDCMVKQPASNRNISNTNLSSVSSGRGDGQEPSDEMSSS